MKIEDFLDNEALMKAYDLTREIAELIQHELLFEGRTLSLKELRIATKQLRSLGHLLNQNLKTAALIIDVHLDRSNKSSQEGEKKEIKMNEE